MLVGMRGVRGLGTEGRLGMEGEAGETPIPQVVVGRGEGVGCIFGVGTGLGDGASTVAGLENSSLFPISIPISLESKTPPSSPSSAKKCLKNDCKHKGKTL